MLKWIAVSVLAFLPIFFLPITQDFYDTNKWILLVLTASLLLLVTGISLIFKKGPVVTTPPSGAFAFGALSLAALLSLVLASANRVEALVSPLGLAAMLSLAIIVSSALTLTAHVKKMLTYGLYLAAGALNLIAIYQFFGMGRVMFPGITYLSDALWTPGGAVTTTIAVSVISLALLIPDIVREVKKAHEHQTASFLVLTLFIISLGTVLTVWQFTTRFQTSHMPVATAWAVTLHALSSTRTALFGTGAENFVTSYTQGKPISLVTTPLWNVRFAASANFFLHITTVYGIIGLISALIFSYLLLRGTKRPYMTARVVSVIVLVMFPPTLTILTCIAVLFILSEPEITHPGRTITSPIRIISGILLTILGIGVLYFAGRFYTGELYYFRALTAAQKNEGTNTYNDMVSAIKADAFLSRYHITMSQVNLSLANSLASQTLQKPTSTTAEDDRKLMSELVQQGISEGKVAVTLNPQSILAWENLGNVYQAVMSIASGADSWAAASYTKALSMDPTNPVLAVNLGGILVHEKKYDDAVSAFNRAILLKADYANAYYNLANAYKLKGDTTQAVAALTKTMTLVQAGSSDYTKVKNELDSLQGNPTSPPASGNSGASQLTLPQ